MNESTAGRAAEAADPAILYLTTTDFAKPIGPSVNEYEFWLSLQNSPHRALAVAPEPSQRVEGLDSQKVRLFKPAKAKLWGMLVANQVRLAKAAYGPLRHAGRSVRTIVVCRTPFLPWSIGLLMLLFPRTPFFFKSVGDTEFLHRQRGLRKLLTLPLRPLQSAVTGWVFRRAAGLDTPTGPLVELLAGWYDLDPRKLHVVSNSTNIDRFTPGSFVQDKPHFVIGYIGGHPWIRGGRVIIEVCARLRSRHPSLRGLIVGGDVGPLRDFAEQHGVADICQVIDKIPYADVPERLGEIDLVIATDDPERAKGGNSNQKIRQALAAGIPVISNPHCEPVLLETGAVTGAYTGGIEPVVAAVEDIMGWDVQRRADFAKRAREVVEEHFSTAATLRMRMEFWTSHLAG